MMLRAPAIVAGALVLGGSAAQAGASGTVLIDGGAAVTNKTVPTVIGIASDPNAVAWRLSDSPAATAGVLDVGVTQAYQSGGALVNWPLTNPAVGGDPADGPHTVYVQWQDGGGSWSAITSATVLLDTTPPDATASTNVGSAWTTSPAVRVTTAATDALTGLTHLRVSNFDWTDADGELVPGVSYPAGAGMPIPWDITADTRVIGAVYVQWQDGAGNWSGPITLPVNWDASSPQVTEPATQLRPGAAIVGGAIPVTTSWTQSTIAPLDHNLLERRRGGSLYASVYRGSRHTFHGRVAPGRLFWMRVRATDVAGLQSRWASGRSFSTGLIDDRDPRIVWTPGWRRVRDPDAVGGGMRCATRGGRSVYILVDRAAELGFVSPEGRRYGSAAVSVWGNRYTLQTVPLTRSTPRARVLAFSYTYSVAGRVPTAELRVKDASSNGAPVCIDAFTVLR
ncbi:MAG TPA: hypothetical protein VFW14_20565 [Gaiellales bacterium]|nr:hypothetical protein [Gaiellales bacterium]